MTSPDGRSEWLRVAGRFTAYLAFSLTAHGYVLHHPIPCDNCLYIRYARDWAAGATLYAERYEAKTPVVFWLFRLIDSPDIQLSLYLWSAALLATAATILWWALRPLAPTTAATAPVVLIAWVAAVGNHHLYDSFALPLAVVAFAATGAAVAGNSRVVWPSVAGAAFAVIVGLFPPTVAYALALIPFAVWDARMNGVRRFVGRATVFTAAGGAVVVAVLSHAVASGYLAPLFDALADAGRYGSPKAVTPAEHFDRWWPQFGRIARGGGPAFLVAAVGVGLVLTRWGSLSPAVRAWAVATVLWLVTAQAGTFPGGRHFHNYYSLLVGPLSVLAGLSLASVPETAAVRRWRTWALVCLAILSIILSVLAHARLAVEYKRKDLANRRHLIRLIASYMGQMMPKDEPVVVAVWNEWAELYVREARPSPSRHVIPWNLAETRPDLFHDWAAEVLARPPEWIICDNMLLGPELTDDSIRGRVGGFGVRAMLESTAYTRLRAVVAREYQVVNGGGGLLIMRRITPEKPRS